MTAIAHIPTRVAALLLILLLVAACGRIAPATEPAQLSQTAGPPVTVTDRSVTTIAYTVDYPADWRVITSPAFAQPWTVFAHPEDRAVIVVAVDPDDTDVPPSNPNGAIIRVEATAEAAAETVTVVLLTGVDDQTTMQAMFEAVLASVR